MPQKLSIISGVVSHIPTPGVMEISLRRDTGLRSIQESITAVASVLKGPGPQGIEPLFCHLRGSLAISLMTGSGT
jgi:hypothetical protein